MNIDALKVAKFFATVKHGGAALPYTHHLAAVEMIVRRFGDSILAEVGKQFPDRPFRATMAMQDAYASMDALLVATWLHDVVEDCGVKPKEIREMFGDEVAHLVAAVTDEPGENRKVRKALTYPKTRAAGRFAVALKLADRIANVEAGGKLVDMYRKEHEDFRRALYTPGENEAMWAHLDQLMKGEDDGAARGTA